MQWTEEGYRVSRALCTKNWVTANTSRKRGNAAFKTTT